MASQYDLVIIGGGVAGRAVAETYKRGRWAIVDDAGFGGYQRVDCLHRAIEAAKDWPEVAEAYRNQIQAADWQGQLQAQGLTTIVGRAIFRTKSDLEINGTIVSSKEIYLATGASPRPLEVVVKESVTVLDLVKLQQLPARLVMIGQDDSGLAIAAALTKLGTRVTVLTKQPIDRLAQHRLKQTGVVVATGQVASFERLQRAIRVNFLADGQPDSIVTELILNNQEWQPNLRLNLAATGIEFDSNGILVDSANRTSVRGIWAVGACTQSR